MAEAAVKLNMTRQNLSKHLSAEPLSKHFLRQFNEVFPPARKATKVSHVQEEGVPYYPIDVSASNVDIFNDHEEASTMRVVMPGWEDCDMALPVFGHSMYPTFENGTIIGYKRIHDLDVINYGEAYLIITKEQRLLKRIQKGSADSTVLLTSDNDEMRKDGARRYEAWELDRRKIVRLYCVMACAKRLQI